MLSHNQRGLSLIELMVSLTIFAIGILAITRLQFLSFRMMNQGLLRTVAIEQASNLLLRYRVLRQGEAFNAAFIQWQTELPQWLPQATVVFSALGPVCSFHLKWQPLPALFNPDGLPLDLVDELDYSG
jgi:prepilin-type N-terminal cleavage/methylation domain-containing protein